MSRALCSFPVPALLALLLLPSLSLLADATFTTFAFVCSLFHFPSVLGSHSPRSVILFSPSVLQIPSVVYLPKGPADVSAVVKHLRKHNIPMSIMGGGHSFSGASLKHGAALIRLKHMNHVHVDAREKSAWVGAGALLADIDNEAAGASA